VENFKQLEFTFGLNTVSRDAYGLFIYNSNRLIIMFERTRCQQSSREYRGVVGVVNIPYFLSDPTHNKQDFKGSKEKRNIISAMNKCMEQYLKDLDLNLDRAFWTNYGYVSFDILMPESEEMYMKRIYARILKQCSRCLFWRTLPFSIYNFSQILPDEKWECKHSAGITNEKLVHVFYLSICAVFCLSSIFFAFAFRYRYSVSPF
jgi:hypothetical protein